MMAITPSFLDGRLDIVGDAANDTVVMSTVNISGVPHVTVNGLAVGSGVPAAAVTSIVADLGAGNDTMNLSTLNLTPFSGLTSGSITLRGGAGNDNLTGTALADTLIGGDNNDILVGGAGNDIIDAGNANDTLDGGEGDDQLIGGNGIDNYRSTGSGQLGSDTLVESPNDNLDDTLHFAALGGPVTVDLALTTPQVIRPGLLTITLSSGTAFERIEGTGFADVLYGNSRNNYINGASGNDVIWGRDGADNLLGGNGDDVIWGDGGNDTINGGANSDTLYGNEGDDDLTGFTGSDYLAGGTGADAYTFTTSGAGGLDTIDEAQGGGEDRFNVAGLPLTAFPDFDSTAVQAITALQSIQFVTAGAVEWFLGGGGNRQHDTPLYQGGYLNVPGQPGTLTTLEFRYGGAVAGYNNTSYVYDASPGATAQTTYLFTGNVTAPGSTKVLVFSAGAKLGFYISQNGSANDLFYADDDKNDNDVAANSNRNHVIAFTPRSDEVQFRWEDLYYERPNPRGYVLDSDYNDLIMGVKVLVVDNNDPPVITSNGGGATAAVTVPENQSAVTAVTATDPDVPAQTLTYSITGGADQALFTIASATGALAFITPPNYDEPTDAGANNVYDVQVTATDSGTPRLTDVQDIAVSVADINEAPVITSDGSGTAASVEVFENQTAVTTVAATDPDRPAQTLTYSITGGADQALFTIVSASGILAFLAPPDYDDPGDVGADNVYDVQITVTDSGSPSLTDAQSIAVIVKDQNEAPVITSYGGGASAAVEVPENESAVTTVTATDEDHPAQTLTFSITGGADQALFSIDSATGALTFIASPNYEDPEDAGADNVYDVQVTVTDSGTPHLTDVQDITVNVTDVSNDDTPEIISLVYRTESGDQIDLIQEGQILFVSGTVKFRRQVPSVEVLVWADRNYDGVRDPSEVSSVQATPTSQSSENGDRFYQFSKWFVVLDDGPSPGNGRPTDALHVDATPAGGSAYNSFIMVLNVAPKWVDFPTLNAQFNQFGVIESASISAGFQDAGVLDRHGVQVLVDGVLTSQSLIPAGRVGFSIELGLLTTSRGANITVNLYDDDTGVVSFYITLASIVSKSFIANIYTTSGVGSVSSVGNVAVDAAALASARLEAFGVVTIADFAENPGALLQVDADGRLADSRLYSRDQYIVGYDGQSVQYFQRLDAGSELRAGTEVFGFVPAIIEEGDRYLRQTGPASGEAGLFVLGRPNPNLEYVALNLVMTRTSTDIWYKLDVGFVIHGNFARFSLENSDASAFPSNRVWINTELVSDYMQSTLVKLWQSSPLYGADFIAGKDEVGIFEEQYSFVSDVYWLPVEN